MGRRANGEGSIYQRKDGRWAASLTLEHGRRKHFFGKTRHEASVKLNAALKARQDGLPIPGDRQTVAMFLEDWLVAIEPSLRPGTFRRYREYVRLHLTPTIGRVALARLTPQQVQRLYADRLAFGLSHTTVGHMHAVLHHALSQAARWGLVTRNVAGLVSRPRAEHHEMMALSPDKARALLEAAQGDRFEALYVLALSTGMRQGELLALKWPDVDLDARRLAVRSTLRRTDNGFVFNEPKTARSRRQVSLTMTAVAALKRHRTQQLEERLRQPYWQDANLVFATEVGTPVEATNLIRRSFRPLLLRAGLPQIRFHDLRHTAATLLLGQGVHPKVASEMLGHSSISITLDLYSHVTPTMQQTAVDALDAVLGGTSGL